MCPTVWLIRLPISALSFSIRVVFPTPEGPPITMEVILSCACDPLAAPMLSPVQVR